MDLPGPFPVGRYARKLQEEMRKRARVQLIGEVTGVGRSKVQAYFELRDGEGAVPCTIWLNDLEKAGLPEGALRDGAELVIAGGPDYYPGGGQASPSFSFRATHVRLAGEGDLLARLEALRKQLRAEGLFELQKQLARPLLPKAIGVVTAESGAARRDLLAGLRRRGWGGTVVWAFAPVQDRHAAPAIARGDPGPGGAARGRGDRRHPGRRQPRRPLGLLRRDPLPHGGDAAGAGGQRDRPRARLDPDRRRRRGRLLDPHPRGRGGGAARLRRRRVATCERAAFSLRRAGEGAIGARARHLAALARGPARALQRERGGLNQKIREIRAASERGLAERGAFQRRIATVVLDRARRRGIERTAAAAAEERRRGAAIERSASRALQRRREALRKAAVTLRAHDPERTLERGYALAETATGEPRDARRTPLSPPRQVRLRFADGRVKAQIEGEIEREAR